MRDVCSLEMLQGLIKRQMAFEHIFAAEKLTVSDAEIQQEYDEAARDFIGREQEFDADRLREQVVEMLKVRSDYRVGRTLLTTRWFEGEHAVLIACGVHRQSLANAVATAIRNLCCSLQLSAACRARNVCSKVFQFK